MMFLMAAMVVAATSGDPRVATALLEARPALDACQAKVTPATSGTLELTMRVTPSGDIEDVVVSTDAMRIPAITTCVLEVVDGLRVPANDASPTSSSSKPSPSSRSRRAG